MSDGKGLRFNKDKLPMHLIPASAEQALAEVLAAGAKKYEERNWERGMKWSICYASLRRHLLAWWQGEDCDKETLLNHLKHCLTNIAFLIEYTETYPEGDDRPKRQKSDTTQLDLPINYLDNKTKL